MDLAIIDCAAEAVSLALYKREAGRLRLKERKKASLKNNNLSQEEWIFQAVAKLIELKTQVSYQNLPTRIILPSFCVHSQTIKVPKVDNFKQRQVIQEHLKLNRPECKFCYYNYLEIQSNEWNIEILVFFVKKQWLNQFCKELDSLKLKIESFEAPGLGVYYSCCKYTSHM